MSRSKFEVDLKKKLKNCRYEPFKIPYTYEAEYIPDFVPKNNDKLLIEAKGRFRTRQEAKKYMAVRDSNPDLEIVFIFYNPKVPMPGTRRRKDGSRQSHADWADKNGFRWCTIRNIPAEWRK